MTTPEDYLIAENPEADPDRIRGILARLNERGIFLFLPDDDTLPAGATVMSSGDVVRETNPVVWTPDGHTPVVLSWGKSKLYRMDDTIPVIDEKG